MPLRTNRPELEDYYCYLYNGIPTAQRIRPSNWEPGGDNYITNAPNTQVALINYETELKVRGWKR